MLLIWLLCRTTNTYSASAMERSSCKFNVSSSVGSFTDLYSGKIGKINFALEPPSFTNAFSVNCFPMKSDLFSGSKCNAAGTPFYWNVTVNLSGSYCSMKRRIQCHCIPCELEKESKQTEPYIVFRAACRCSSHGESWTFIIELA